MGTEEEKVNTESRERKRKYMEIHGHIKFDVKIDWNILLCTLM